MHRRVIMPESRAIVCTDRASPRSNRRNADPLRSMTDGMRRQAASTA